MRSLVKNNLNLFVAGFGCCKQEIFATGGPVYDISRFGINFTSIPEESDVLVIQGFYNKEGQTRLLKYYARMREPKWVIAVGKCVVDCNLLNKSFQFDNDFRETMKVDFFVPGCPPRPETFMYAILRLLESPPDY
jgi:NADH-quinone oxidoreductase subunit B